MIGNLPIPALTSIRLNAFQEMPRHQLETIVWRIFSWLHDCSQDTNVLHQFVSNIHCADLNSRENLGSLPDLFFIPRGSDRLCRPHQLIDHVYTPFRLVCFVGQ